VSYDNPTPNVAALRTMVFALPTVIGLGWTTAMFHFPQATPVNDSGVAVDPLPLFEVEDHEEDNGSNIAGGTPLPQGRLKLTLAANLAAGVLEGIAKAIARELRAAQTGLPITNAQAGMASDKTIAAEASQDSDGAAAGQIAYRVCVIDITFGLNY
jgi:hypothetical protein